MARGLLSSSRGGVLVGVICLVLVSLSEGIHATDRAGRTRGIRLPQAAFREVPWGQRGSESSHKCAMRLRGGGIFTQIDEAGASCFGRTMWSIVKSALGLSSKPKNTPAEDLAELQAMNEKRREMRGKNVPDAKIKDSRTLYLFSQGLVYALNPMTHVARYMRGTERQVRDAVVFLQDPPKWAEGLSQQKRVDVLAAVVPKGFGLTPARIKEALYRAGMSNGGEGSAVVINGKSGGEAAVEFEDEEDEELKALREKIKVKGGKEISRVATQKYTGSQGGIVKRLQKELIRIQGSGSFEVELVNDSIFEWYVTIEGAKGSFYEGEKFKLRFHFDHTYPMHPPEVTFVVKVSGWENPEVNTKSASGACPSQAKGQEWPERWGSRKHHCPIHPHIYTNGHICLSIIYDDWSPALGVEAVCHSIVSMLSSAKEKNPPADNEMHVDSATTSARKVTGWDFHDNEA